MLSFTRTEAMMALSKTSIRSRQRRSNHVHQQYHALLLVMALLWIVLFLMENNSSQSGVSPSQSSSKNTRWMVHGWSPPQSRTMKRLPNYHHHSRYFSSINNKNKGASFSFRLHVMPLTEEESSSPSKKMSQRQNDDDSSNNDTIKNNANNTTVEKTKDTPLLDWNASGSIGSLLLQMQKKEEELRKLNKTINVEDDLLANQRGGSATNSSSTTTSHPEKRRGSASFRGTTAGAWSRTRGNNKSSNTNKDETKQRSMTAAAAKELDDAVSLRMRASPGKGTQLVDLPDLYNQLLDFNENNNAMTDSTLTPVAKSDVDNSSTSSTTTSTVTTPREELPPLSKSEHYEERMGRDMRYVALNVAASVDTVEDWQEYCQQIPGGVLPLVDCIREGAQCARRGQLEKSSGLAQGEEAFLAASNACRILRNLCALNLDMGSLITDSLLRANAADPLIDDLVTLLKYTHDNPEISRRQQKKGLSMLKKGTKNERKMNFRRNRRAARQQCKLYVLQLLLALTNASDSAVDALRSTSELQPAVLKCSSYAKREQTRRWIRYPKEIVKSMMRLNRSSDSVTPRRRPFIEAASLSNNLSGRTQGTANQLLAAMGYNQWVPKIPGQKGLRILCLDGGGSRGMTSVIAVDEMVKSLGGLEISDCFDFVIGTSTGAIISFLIGLKRETAKRAVERYDVLIPTIFTKSALSTPLLLFTTASYDESPFMEVLCDILGEDTMLDSRADPAVPYVFAVTSKMSSTPTHVALFRNYNYNKGEIPDPFVIKPEDARESLGIGLDMESESIRNNDYPRKVDTTQKTPGKKQADGSRHPGSFRVLQRYALRASTAAPTVFKPVMMGGEMYCDGGIVASNPTAIGIHEARSVFPDIPIELVVSLGTGAFVEQKSAPRVGWDGIIGQIVSSACDGEPIHHILEDVLGEGSTAQLGRSSVSNTRYMRFNPVLGLPDEFPIDITDPEKLERIKVITREYMGQPEQKKKLKHVSDLLKGRRGVRTWFRR